MTVYKHGTDILLIRVIHHVFRTQCIGLLTFSYTDITCLYKLWVAPLLLCCSSQQLSGDSENRDILPEIFWPDWMLLHFIFLIQSLFSIENSTIQCKIIYVSRFICGIKMQQMRKFALIFFLVKQLMIFFLGNLLVFFFLDGEAKILFSRILHKASSKSLFFLGKAADKFFFPGQPTGYSCFLAGEVVIFSSRWA